MSKIPTNIVVRFDVWSDPCFAEILTAAGIADLRTCAREGFEANAWENLQDAQVYQISSAKDELPSQWFAGPELLSRCPKLLCISTTGAGFDTVDVPACTAAGVLVVNQAGANAQSVAEHSLGMMLDLQKRLNESDRLLRKRRGFSREDLMGWEISGRVLGLVGIGHVGTKVAALAQAFGMRVLACDPYLSAGEVSRRGAKQVLLPELLAQSDIVSLYCPRDPDTMNLFDAEVFAAMQPGAMFITTARGGIHNETALAAALQSGHLGGAGIDVWDQEPPPLDHPLLMMTNVVATYHTAGVTVEARRNVANWGARQIIDVLRGKYPRRPVNPEVWPVYESRFNAIMGFEPDSGERTPPTRD